MGKRTPKDNLSDLTSLSGGEDPSTVDSQLFQQANAHVVPLENRHQRIPMKNVPIKRSNSTSVKQKKVEFKVFCDGEFSEGHIVDLDHTLFRHLKSGDMRIDKTLDLHGCTTEEAHRQLVVSVQHAYQSGQRCLLVITGKGIHSGIEAIGILKESLPLWCQDTPLGSIILAFATAMPKHGGTGAFYLLLRRNKTS